VGEFHSGAEPRSPHNKVMVCTRSRKSFPMNTLRSKNKLFGVEPLSAVARFDSTRSAGRTWRLLATLPFPLQLCVLGRAARHFAFFLVYLPLIGSETEVMPMLPSTRGSHHNAANVTPHID
jgi:hypothetical protein